MIWSLEQNLALVTLARGSNKVSFGTVSAHILLPGNSMTLLPCMHPALRMRLDQSYKLPGYLLDRQAVLGTGGKGWVWGFGRISGD